MNLVDPCSLWSSNSIPLFRGWNGKLKYLLYPTHVIELAIILVSISLSIVDLHDGYEVFAFQVVRGVNRLLHVIQMATLGRQIHPWRLFFSVLYAQRRQLFLVLHLEFMLTTSLAYACYLVEHRTNEKLSNFFDALIWSIETLSTTGYGNKVTQTWMGKLLASLYVTVSVVVFALQGTIIGVGWALKKDESLRDKMLKDKKHKAAIVIQMAWRFHWSRRIYLALRNNFGFLCASKRFVAN